MFQFSAAPANNVNVSIQINGKTRGIVSVKQGISQSICENTDTTQSIIKPFVKDKMIKKVIFVKDKIINFVVA